MKEKRRQVQLKMHVHRLRHQVRRVKDFDRNPRAITDDSRKFDDEWRSGRLAQELDECTQAHGSGKLQSIGEMLQSEGFCGPPRRVRRTKGSTAIKR